MRENMESVRTSNNAWVKDLSKAYKTKTPIQLVDDAKIGIDPTKDTLLQMGRKAELGTREWVAVVIALGVAASGAYLLVMAIIDPEPFSKLTFAIGAGAVLTLGGGYGAVSVLTKTKPPRVIEIPDGFEIHWA
jgi:hypothetical protein